MYKVDLEKAEGSEKKIANIFWIIEKSKTIPNKNTSISASSNMLKPLTVWITTNCGKFWKEMGIADHLTCLLKNLYSGQEAIVRTRHGATNCFKIGKGVHQGCILSPYLFNYYAEFIMRMMGWINHKLESRLPEEISITLDMQITSPLWQKVKKN